MIALKILIDWYLLLSNKNSFSKNLIFAPHFVAEASDILTKPTFLNSISHDLELRNLTPSPAVLAPNKRINFSKNFDRVNVYIILPVMSDPSIPS